MDGLVEKDDLEVLKDVNKGGELTNNKLLVFNEFSGLMWVSK